MIAFKTDSLILSKSHVNNIHGGVEISARCNFGYCSLKSMHLEESHEQVFMGLMSGFLQYVLLSSTGANMGLKAHHFFRGFHDAASSFVFKLWNFFLKDVTPDFI